MPLAPQRLELCSRITYLRAKFSCSEVDLLDLLGKRAFRCHIDGPQRHAKRQFLTSVLIADSVRRYQR